ncbi:hydrogenase expression/formation protein [Sulfuriferula plumbiphila]|uniref:Hydrogenase expression/formation protein n=2 Tax=Sulfuriferula plumbiphila TaxID=171865 RepID=A0A512LBB2_9PROT|nr:hydrogenase expression/formation protein [Sulfuriferula plumbiphila]GEP31775.1 hydrogenase expression/formation protein [Sulfuriferula plumbiphila]
MNEFPIPVVSFGPGSQPEDETLDYMNMPKGMAVFNPPSVPDDVAPELRDQAANLIRQLLAQMRAYRFGATSYPKIDLLKYDPRVVPLINDILGQGEVSIIAHQPTALRAQETVFASVWRVCYPGADGVLERDYLEVCPIPAVVAEIALAPTLKQISPPPPPAGAMNSPALLHEILDVVSTYQAGNPAHIINLTLLPLTPDDLAYLVQALGPGSVSILSRGYGNCRITSSGLANVWWVQYFNSSDQLILNTIEVVEVPEVALAAEEDFSDSIERVEEWLGTMLAA